MHKIANTGGNYRAASSFPESVLTMTLMMLALSTPVVDLKLANEFDNKDLKYVVIQIIEFVELSE